MSRYTRPSPVEPVRWTERRRQLLLLTLQYRVITREIAQLRLYTPGARSQVQRDLTHLWHSGILSKIPGRASTTCDVYELSRSSPRGLREAEAQAGRELVKQRLGRPPALEHALAVNEVRARLEASSLDHHFQLQRWLDELDLNHLAGHGITPDAFFEVVRRDEKERRRSAFFLETELATVSRPHWRRRLMAYRSFYYSGRYAEIFGGLRSLRLLVIVRGRGGQAERILTDAAEVDFTPLRLTTWPELRNIPPSGLLFAAVWRKPLESGLASLFGASGGNDSDLKVVPGGGGHIWVGLPELSVPCHGLESKR
jgi:hypothetical protein